ncbi:hypothetical protein UY3_03480 [Chelonia mydas]|uniref:Uncharacterized protein n=1 Tax=Chelonia mydas TaxID=8469 RepID=M7CER4_CHEMY|nr:hypothetical protein UY3_03480 [Chelonia mydas]
MPRQDGPFLERLERCEGLGGMTLQGLAPKDSLYDLVCLFNGSRDPLLQSEGSLPCGISIAQFALTSGPG